MVIQWSDNPGFTKADRMRFIFTSSYTGASTGMNTLEGLEAMRMWPTYTAGVNIGLGDFSAAATDPQERLDILTCRVRIRRLPTDPEDATLNKFMVVDNDGVVHWRNLGNSDCEWTLQGTLGSNSNLSTAYLLNTGCPQMDKGVGIGIQIPKAKLDVLHNDFTGGLDPMAIQGSVTPNDPDVTFLGVLGLSEVQGNSTTVGYESFGVYGRAKNSRTMHGVEGQAMMADDQVGTEAIGVYGKATANTQASYGFAVGVYGTVSTPVTTNAWAGYFQGPVQITGSLYHGSSFIFSDESLKTNVQDLPNMADQLAALAPRSYSFTPEAQQRLMLPSGEQFGLIAQDVENVLPQVVSSTHVPAVLDSLGNEVAPALDLKAVNYVALIPLLIAGYQQQQATIAQLQNQINQCCASQGSSMAPQGEGNTKSASQNEGDVQEERLLVQPNPFTDHTTLQYYVPKTGKVSLQVSSSDGRTLGTLLEEQADAGAYSYEWNTTQLSPGTYFCALVVDGNVVVKRAVKVAR